MLLAEKLKTMSWSFGNAGSGLKLHMMQDDSTSINKIAKLIEKSRVFRRRLSN
jgi:hypothetical protein